MTSEPFARVAVDDSKVSGAFIIASQWMRDLPFLLDHAEWDVSHRYNPTKVNTKVDPIHES